MEGLFRQSGLASHIQELKVSFDRGEYVDLADEDDPHSVASLLKLFLRELGDPVLTFDSHDAFLQIQSSLASMDDAWITSIQNLLNTLPIENKRVFKKIMDLAHEIVQHSDKNLMSSKNIAIVLAPNLLRNKDQSNTVIVMKETGICNSIIKKNA